MKASATVKQIIKNGELDEKLLDIYVDESLLDYQKSRYIKAIEKFEELYGEGDIAIYSAPGRSEIGGNHTDHQRGQVLACGLILDAIAVVAPSDDGIIQILSDEYDLKDIDINKLSLSDVEEGTSEAIVAGVVSKLKEDGYKVGGFKTFITSDVLRGSGMSSSACFEVLIGNIQSYLYNEGKISPIYIAQASQYSENVYFGKPCGLMDQMASSVGSLVNIDFKDVKNPVVKKVDVDFDKFKTSLCIVDTKGSHADLTPEYAAIPREMKSVASYFGKEVLRDVDEKDFYENIPVLREKFGDRAVIRAIHFYKDHNLVSEEVAALEAGDFDKFKKCIKESGDSSFRFLQNVYPVCDLNSQGVGICIALTERILGDKGVCRVHGGGFAGTMQAFVANDFVDVYKKEIEKYFGEGSCHVLKVRKYGGMKVID